MYFLFFCYVYFVYMYLFCYAAIWTFLNCINNFSDLLIGVLYVQAIKIKKKQYEHASVASSQFGENRFI